jgi:hypothetical protein
MAFRICHIDDSGASAAGCAVFSWIEVDAATHAEATAAWLDFRQRLSERFRIPVDREIHSVDFLHGRGNPSLDEAWNRSKPGRIAVYAEALTAIRKLPGVKIGAVYRFTDCRRDEFTTVAQDVYGQLVERLDRRLADDGARGLTVVDGDGSNFGYRPAHRELTGKHLVAGPFFEPSDLNQWIQIADIAAYTAYQAIIRQPTKRSWWCWYEQVLTGDDPLSV